MPEIQNIWLYVHFPELAIEAVLLDMDKLPIDSPIVISSPQKNAQRIICCNQLAKTWGIEPSLSLSTALAICPQLMVVAKNKQQEERLLQQLALISYSFSPEVIVDIDGLWLNLSGCEQLSHSYQELLKRLQVKLSTQVAFIVTGVGESPLAAKLLCGSQFHKHLPNSHEIQSALVSTPIDRLPSTLKQQQSFKQLGFKTIGDLLKLPRSDLSQRFSNELMATLQLLQGQKPCTLTRFQPSTEFYDEIQNPQGLYNKESLLFPMKTLLQRFSQYLIARQCHCTQLSWRFEPLLGDHQTMTLNLSSSKNNCSSLFTLSRIQLEAIELPQSIERVSLFCNQFVDVTESNFDLFGNQVLLENQASELIDKLYARLGVNALSQLVTSEEYLPELANNTQPPSKNTKTNYVASKAPQPLWLLNEPIPIQERNQKLYWRRPLTIISGPERLCGNWWQSEQQRDYYLACDSKCARYWIFRETTDKCWFVHGLFS